MEAGGKRKREKCRLKETGNINAWCTREKCIFWRLAQAQDVYISNETGCGLQYFDILDKVDPELARWLIETKEKLENSDPFEEKARINFRYRED